jgi:hypothetical protein
MHVKQVKKTQWLRYTLKFTVIYYWSGNIQALILGHHCTGWVSDITFCFYHLSYLPCAGYRLWFLGKELQLFMREKGHVYVYVVVCVCVCVCVCPAYVYMYVCVYTFICIYAYAHVYVHICVCVYACVMVCVCVYVYAHVYVHVCVMYMYDTHTHTHTHTWRVYRMHTYVYILKPTYCGVARRVCNA